MKTFLADAYFGFLFFWLWVAWREPSAAKGAIGRGKHDGIRS